MKLFFIGIYNGYEFFKFNYNDMACYLQGGYLGTPKNQSANRFASY
ncbi:hypothetical protein GMMP1_470022 [Candidatus Magnetomoraceae bacterium gMMP-1]